MSNNRNTSKNFVSGLVSGAGCFVLRAASNILLAPIIIKFLGLTSFGFYVFLLSLSDLLFMLDAGLTNGLIHQLSHYHSLKEQEDAQAHIHAQLSLAHKLYLGIALLLALAGFLLAPHLDLMFKNPLPGASLAFTIVFIDSAFNLYACFYRAVLKAHCQHQWTNVADSMQAILGNASSVILLMLGRGLVEIMAARMVCNLLIGAFLFWKAREHQPDLFQSPRALKANKVVTSRSELFRISFYSTILRLSLFFSLKMDDFVIATFLNMTQVGIYGLVYRIFSQLIQFATRFLEGLFPIFVKFSAQNEQEKTRFFFLRISSFTHFLISVLLLLILINYETIVHFMSAGHIHAQETWGLALVIASIVWMVAVQFPANNYLFASSHQRFLTIVSVAASLCNFLISILLVRQIGPVGVALGTMIPQAVQFLGFNLRITCQDLKVSAQDYIHIVLLKNAPALLCLSGLGFTANWLSAGLTWGWLLTLTVSGLATGLAIWIWLMTSASAEERRLIFEKLDMLTNRLKSIFVERPTKDDITPIIPPVTAGAANHD